MKMLLIKLIVTIKFHCHLKYKWHGRTQTHVGGSKCPVRKCGLYGFIDDELPSQYYKDLLLHQYTEFPAPSSDDKLPVQDIDGELPCNNEGEMEVSNNIVGMLEEELRMLKSKTKVHDWIILVLATYTEFPAPSSDDKLPAQDIDGELPCNNEGEMEVSNNIV
nr:hypothetical protein [Tanacetum cinerariifolium]